MKQPETQMTVSLILAKAKWETDISTCLQCTGLSMKQSGVLRISLGLQRNAESKWMHSSHLFIKWKRTHILGEVSTRAKASSSAFCHHVHLGLWISFVTPFPVQNSSDIISNWLCSEPNCLTGPHLHREGAAPTVLLSQWVAILLAFWVFLILYNY